MAVVGLPRRRRETGLCPRDHALGLQDGSLSPGVLRMVGRVGAMVSFEEGHELLTELARVEVPTKHVERAAEALGREVAEDEVLAEDADAERHVAELAGQRDGVPEAAQELPGGRAPTDVGQLGVLGRRGTDEIAAQLDA